MNHATVDGNSAMNIKPVMATTIKGIGDKP
jgi:hypothetical protein